MKKIQAKLQMERKKVCHHSVCFIFMFAICEYNLIAGGTTESSEAEKSNANAKLPE